MKIRLGNNRGIALIASYIIIAVLLIVSAAFSARSIGEQRVANKEKDSVQAFWLAEAGLDRAINELPDTPLSGTLGRGAYSTQTSVATSVRFLITSSGGVPGLDTTDPNNIVHNNSPGGAAGKCCQRRRYHFSYHSEWRCSGQRKCRGKW